MDPLIILLIGMVTVVGGILVLRLHAFLALVAGALVVGFLTPDSALQGFAEAKGMSESAALAFVDSPTVSRLTTKFGETCAKIGILIAMASIIGKCLLESGAADRIVRAIVGLFGQSRAPVAFTASGFFLGIPVFFDTVFYLLFPLAKAMGLRRPSNYLLYILTISAGATMAHSLVPPTPGPLLVASETGVSVAVMMIGGIGVGLVACTAGVIFALIVNRFLPVPLRETSDASLEELKQVAERDTKDLPPLWLSVLPIALPVVLIAGFAVLQNLLSAPPADGSSLALLYGVFEFLGNKNMALIIAGAIALGTVVWVKRADHYSMVDSIQAALASGGVIILITAAGGAFGGLLQQTGIGPRIEELASTYQMAVLPLAFGVTTLVRIAQGSATVAMITAVGIFSGMASPEQLGFHPVYLALAIGCGSKPYPWMNDSGFWVVCKMSAMTEAEVLRSYSVMLALMGFVGLGVVMLFAKWMPMVG
jgi:gluconate:H+ symporter, GntP family